MRGVCVLVIALAGTGAAEAGAESPRPATVARLADEPADATCFRAWPSAVYIGVGWTHFVDVANDCRVPIACEVATTVDPSPSIAIVVAPGTTVRVRTRYGSNTWVFGAIVSCREVG